MTIRLRGVSGEDEVRELQSKGTPLIPVLHDQYLYVVIEESYGEDSFQGTSWRPLRPLP